ncbi:TlpA family protein disulfide reductase [Tenacibaculum sp. nBUS_03]|uniref:TlpA family protein disulfide reductase n=1 Tax=Tenacibaculum sp. nBUS_03 TaxID=3395320 RepID=UPI003EBBA9B6
MKKLVLLAFLGCIIVSCEKKKPIKDYLVISGSIDNFKKRDVKLQGFGFEKKIKFDKKNKTFIDTIKIDKDGYYKLIVNKNPINLYLTKNEDTKLTFDYKKLGVIKFDGDNAVINEYFIKKSKIYKEQIGHIKKILILDQEAFLNKIDVYKNAITDLAVGSQLPEAFLKKEIKNIEYEYLMFLYKYPEFHPYLTGNDEFVLSENFPSVSDKISYNNSEDYINSAYYREILEGEIKRKTNARLKETGDFFLTYIETIHNEVSDSITKNDLLFSDKYDSNAKIGISTTDDPENFYYKFLKYSTNQSHKDRITEMYNSLKITAKGKPSPKFENYENYDGSTTSLDDLLGKGKYIYIDVWATWCGYCKRETPLLKRLELQYHDKNIEFVSISVDNINAKEKWKQTIDQKEMGGIQLFADKSLGSDFTKKYAIKVLPRFIMIDPEGNIVSRNAPRPSNDEKLLNMFEELGI